MARVGPHSVFWFSPAATSISWHVSLLAQLLQLRGLPQYTATGYWSTNDAHSVIWLQCTAHFRVLTFLQGLLESRKSMLKVHAATIASCLSTVDGFSLGVHKLLTAFLKGSRPLHLPHYPKSPAWDLTFVPLRPPIMSPFSMLTLKTPLILLALISAKRVWELQALAISNKHWQ